MPPRSVGGLALIPQPKTCGSAPLVSDPPKTKTCGGADGIQLVDFSRDVITGSPHIRLEYE